jgi:hypothetical protein
MTFNITHLELLLLIAAIVAMLTRKLHVRYSVGLFCHLQCSSFLT